MTKFFRVRFCLGQCVPTPSQVDGNRAKASPCRDVHLNIDFPSWVHSNSHLLSAVHERYGEHCPGEKTMTPLTSLTGCDGGIVKKCSNSLSTFSREISSPSNNFSAVRSKWKRLSNTKRHCSSAGIKPLDRVLS